MKTILRMLNKASENFRPSKFKNLKNLYLSQAGLNCYIEEDIKSYIESQIYCGVLQRTLIFGFNFESLGFFTSVCDTYLNSSKEESQNTQSAHVIENLPLNYCLDKHYGSLNNFNESRCNMAYAAEDSWCDDFTISANASTQAMRDIEQESWNNVYDNTGLETHQLNFDITELHIDIQKQSEVTDEEEEVTNINEDNVNKEREFVLVESHPLKLFISNINFKTPQYKLWQLMEEFGDVKYCSLMKDHRKRSKGRGFVKFKELKAVQRILCASDEQLTLDKRVLKVEPALWKKYLPEVEESNSYTSNSDKIEKNRDKNKSAEPLLESWVDDETTEVLNSNANKSADRKNINDLNEYILLHIFSYLPWNKRIECERVCRKWKSISLKCWQATTNLSFYGVMPSFTIFTDKMLKKLLKRNCPVLQSLDLSSVSRVLSRTSLETIGKECPNLKCLDMTGMSTSSKGLKPIGEGCKYLEWLKLKDCHDVCDKSLFSLFVNCKKLKYLNLEGNRRISGKCFHISQPNIQTLILTDCVQISDEGILKISNRWNTLTTLHLSGCSNISDDAFKTLTERCSQIKIFEMMGHVNHLTPIGCRYIGNLSQLQELNLNRNPSVNDSVIIAISQCKKLSKLDLMLCWKDITDDGLKSLADCPQLEYLDIGYLIKVTDDSIIQLAMNGKLKSLTARGCSNITEQGFESIISLCPNLLLLDMCGCTQVTRNVLQSFKTQDNLLTNHKNMMELFIGGTSIEHEEVKDLPDYVKVHFHNLCVSRLRPDREIFIYMGGDTDEEDENEDYDQNYDLADDYLDYDDPLFEERFNIS